MSGTSLEFQRRLKLSRKALIAVVFGLALILGLASAPVLAQSVGVDFRQCSNDDATLGDCTWINSILQQNNSVYFEHMGVPQRLILVDIPATTGDIHSLTFNHQATKASAPAHAYDWLISYDQADTIASEFGNPFTNLDGQTCGANIGPKVTTAECESLRTGPYCIDVDIPDDPYVSQVFGVGTGSYQARIDAFEAQYGNRTLRICGNAAITSSSLALLGHDEANDSSGDDYINYELTWTSASTQVLVMVAGHLSSGSASTGWSWGAGFGSASISGGPYHFIIDELDDASLGAQDNQIKGADVLVPASKRGIKWEDLNADGVKDAGEPGLGGFTIYVDYNNNGTLDAGEPFGVTSSDAATLGMYGISNINPGTWKVREVDQVGWNQSFPDGIEAGTECDQFGCYYLEEFEVGIEYPNNDFGNWRYATKSGHKYEDLNADGDLSDGLPVQGVTIYLLSSDGNTVVDSTTTNASGYYSFTVMPGVSYLVCEQDVSSVGDGWTQSAPNNSVCDGATGASVEDGGYEINLDSNETEDDNDFGNWRYAAKSGYKWHDLNADGNWDGNELPLEGWNIHLLRRDNGTWTHVNTNTYTDDTGKYEFDDIMPGETYAVCEVLPDGWEQTFPTDPAADGFVDCDAIAAVHGPVGYEITLTSGQEHTDNDFGNLDVDLELEVTKACTDNVFVGDTIAYTVEVTNKSTVPLSNVTVHDTLVNLVPSGSFSLAVDESKQLTGSYVPSAAGTVTNTVTAEGEYMSIPVSAEADCISNVYELEISKTANPTFDRVWDWDIVKDGAADLVDPDPNWDYTVKTVDGTDVIEVRNIQLGDQITVKADYTVTVDAVFTDNNYNVAGSIVITNPNPQREAVITSLVDTIGAEEITLSCPVPGPDGWVIPANGGTLVCSYSTPRVDNGDGTNTIDAIQRNTDYTDNSTYIGTDYSAEADFQFGDTPVNEIDRCASVDDDMYGELTDSICVDDDPKTFTYSVTQDPVDAQNCTGIGTPNTQFPNTAIVTEIDTEQKSDSPWIAELQCESPTNLEETEEPDTHREQLFLPMIIR